MHEEHPELLKDQYWEEVVPKDLPYTVASEHYRRHEPPCSADHYKVKAEDAVYANVQAPRKSHDETYADYVSYFIRRLFHLMRFTSITQQTNDRRGDAVGSTVPMKEGNVDASSDNLRQLYGLASLWRF